MKNNHLRLGALNKETGKYELAEYANKNNKYQCPSCKKDVILRKGKILKPHFAHYKSENPCNFYNHPGESDIHKHAKHLMKKLLENKIPITILTQCQCCNEIEEVKIEEIGENSEIIIEYSFTYNESRKFADVAYIDNNEIVCIIEICNKHKTKSENRPEPWFEFDAETIIKQLCYLDTMDSVQLQCIRENYSCEECIRKEKIKKYKYGLSELNDDELENYIKGKLELAYPGRDKLDGGGRYGRLNLHATCEDQVIHNKKIIDVFQNDFPLNCIVGTYKGTTDIYIFKPYPIRSFKNINDIFSTLSFYKGISFELSFYENDIAYKEECISGGTREIIQYIFKKAYETNKYLKLNSEFLNSSFGLGGCDHRMVVKECKENEYIIINLYDREQFDGLEQKIQNVLRQLEKYNTPKLKDDIIICKKNMSIKVYGEYIRDYDEFNSKSYTLSGYDATRFYINSHRNGSLEHLNVYLKVNYRENKLYICAEDQYYYCS